MKRNLMLGLGVVCFILVMLGLAVESEAVESSALISDSSLREMEYRIEETERRLLEMDKEMILNRIDWANWGIDILTEDIRKMEREIEKAREKWEELRKTKMTSEEAWAQWERAGRELDSLEKKKGRLDSVLERLKRLKQQLQARLREFGPKPQLGLGVGTLNAGAGGESSPVLEFGVAPTPKVNFFLGYQIREKIYYRTRYEAVLTYIGASYFITVRKPLKIPVGLIYLLKTNGIEKEEVKPFLGLKLEGPVSKDYRWFFEIKWPVTATLGLTF